MHDQDNRLTRLRYAAAGALIALAAVGAIAGTSALAAKPHAKAQRDAAVANCASTKAPASAVPDKAQAPEPAASPQPFLNDIQRLVDNGTITATEAQAVDREIRAGRVGTDSRTSSGFTPSQLQAVQQALSTTKRGLAAAAHPTTK